MTFEMKRGFELGCPMQCLFLNQLNMYIWIIEQLNCKVPLNLWIIFDRRLFR